MRRSLGIGAWAVMAASADPASTDANKISAFVVPLCDSRRARFIANLGDEKGVEAGKEADREERARLRAVANGAMRTRRNSDRLAAIAADRKTKP